MAKPDAGPPALSPQDRAESVPLINIEEENQSGRGRGRGHRKGRTNSESGALTIPPNPFLHSKQGEDGVLGSFLTHLSTITSSLATANKNSGMVPAALSSQTEAMKNMASAVETLTSRLGALASPSKNRNSDFNYFSENEDEYNEDEDDIDPFNSLMHSVQDDEEASQVTVEEAEINETIQSILDSTDKAPEYGDPLREDVAKSFSRVPNQEVNKDDLERLKEVYKTPDNCRLLGVPRINSDIWSKISASERVADGKFQFIQQYLSRALIAQARLAEAVLVLATDKSKRLLKSDVETLFKNLMDSATCVGLAQKEINLRRRAALKNSLDDAVQSLCSARIPVTELLFGDNLEQEVRAARATSKLVKSKKTFRPFRQHPYQSSNYSQRPGFQTRPLNSWRDPNRMRGGGSQQRYQRPRFRPQPPKK